MSSPTSARGARSRYHVGTRRDGIPRRGGECGRQRVTHRGLAVACVALSACIAVGGCVAPAFDSGAFTHNAIVALDAATSETRTAGLALQGKLDDRLTQPYVDTVVTESEEAIGPIQDSFGSVDPPSEADDALRDDVTALLGDAEDALSAARIAVRHHDEAAMQASLTELGKVSDELKKKSDELS